MNMIGGSYLKTTERPLGSSSVVILYCGRNSNKNLKTSRKTYFECLLVFSATVNAPKDKIQLEHVMMLL